MSTTTELTRTQRKINDLRSCADYLARHHDTIERLSYTNQMRHEDGTEKEYNETTYVDYYLSYGIAFTVSGPDARAMVLELRRALGGTWDKSAYSETFRLTRDDNGLHLSISVDREKVCTPKVTGTTTTVKRDPEQIKALQAKLDAEIQALPEVPITEDIIEYDCGTLAGDEAQS